MAGREQQGNGAVQGRLILLDRQQVVPACRPHLAAEAALAEERIAGEHAVAPIEAGHQRWGHAERRRRFAALARGGGRGDRLDRRMGEHEPSVVTHRTEGMDRTPLRAEAEPAALGLAVDGNPVQGDGRGSSGGDVRRQGRGHRVAIEAAEQPVEGRLARGVNAGEAKGRQHRAVLAHAPLRHRQHGALPG